MNSNNIKSYTYFLKWKKGKNFADGKKTLHLQCALIAKGDSTSSHWIISSKLQLYVILYKFDIQLTIK